MKPTIRIRPSSCSGFTLPEVVIAIGISAMGLVSLLGMIPQSLDTLRQAGQVSSETRIAQQIFARISTSDWQDTRGNDRLTANFQGRRYFFDELAVELDNPTQAFGPAFVAEVSVAPSDVELPQGGSGSSVAPDPHLRRVTVKVTTSPSTSFDFNHAKASAYRTYASVVTRTGR
jgi:uncharacterized protein (TIGR02598 family)